MSDKKEKLVRGSIRVFKDVCFYEDRDIQQMNISYGNMKAILKVTAIPNELKAIFDKANILYEPDTRNGCRLKSEITGLQLDEVKNIENDYVRIYFSGITEAELTPKLTGAYEWLDQHKIPHGESDGKAACIFKCITSEQLELGGY